MEISFYLCKKNFDQLINLENKEDSLEVHGIAENRQNLTKMSGKYPSRTQSRILFANAAKSLLKLNL